MDSIHPPCQCDHRVPLPPPSHFTSIAGRRGLRRACNCWELGVGGLGSQRRAIVQRHSCYSLMHTTVAMYSIMHTLGLLPWCIVIRGRESTQCSSQRQWQEFRGQSVAVASYIKIRCSRSYARASQHHAQQVIEAGDWMLCRARAVGQATLLLRCTRAPRQCFSVLHHTQSTEIN